MNELESMFTKVHSDMIKELEFLDNLAKNKDFEEFSKDVVDLMDFISRQNQLVQNYRTIALSFSRKNRGCISLAEARKLIREAKIHERNSFYEYLLRRAENNNGRIGCMDAMMYISENLWD